MAPRPRAAGGSAGAPPLGTAAAAPPSAAAKMLHDRLLQRRRRRQRLPRGAGLHRQGRGARVRQGLRAHLIHRNTDAAGQLQDIRDLIAKGVNAIVFNPNDPDALNPALDEAKAAGIMTVSVDAYVTDPNTYNLYNNQVDYAYLGAKWLFEQMGGKGNVYYMRGLAGHPADTDRDIGFKKALAEYPDIKVLPNAEASSPAGIRPTATQLINDFIASGEYDEIQGIWTSGMDSPDRRRHQGRQQEVRADRRRRPRRVRRASSSTRPTTRASRARRSPTPPPSVARASPWRSSSSPARRSRPTRRPPSRTPSS